MRIDIRTGVALGVSGLALSGMAAFTPAAQASTAVGGATAVSGQATSTTAVRPIRCTGKKGCKRIGRHVRKDWGWGWGHRGFRHHRFFRHHRKFGFGRGFGYGRGFGRFGYGRGFGYGRNFGKFGYGRNFGYGRGFGGYGGYGYGR